MARMFRRRLNTVLGWITSPAPGFPAEAQKMGAGAEDGRLGLQGPGDVEQVLAPRLIVPACVEVRKQPSGPFHSENFGVAKPRGLELGAQVVRAVEVGRREVIDIVRLVAMLAVFEIPVAN